MSKLSEPGLNVSRFLSYLAQETSGKLWLPPQYAEFSQSHCCPAVDMFWGPCGAILEGISFKNWASSYTGFRRDLPKCPKEKPLQAPLKLQPRGVTFHVFYLSLTLELIPTVYRGYERNFSSRVKVRFVSLHCTQDINVNTYFKYKCLQTLRYRW